MSELGRGEESGTKSLCYRRQVADVELHLRIVSYDESTQDTYSLKGAVWCRDSQLSQLGQLTVGQIVKAQFAKLFAHFGSKWLYILSHQPFSKTHLPKSICRYVGQFLEKLSLVRIRRGRDTSCITTNVNIIILLQ